MGRRKTGLGRYVALLANPARGPDAGWMVYDGRRDRKKGFRTYRGRRGQYRAERRADRLNRKVT